jgi:hypothetical protein
LDAALNAAFGELEIQKATAGKEHDNADDNYTRTRLISAEPENYQNKNKDNEPSSDKMDIDTPKEKQSPTEEEERTSILINSLSKLATESSDYKHQWNHVSGWDLIESLTTEDRNRLETAIQDKQIAELHFHQCHSLKQQGGAETKEYNRRDAVHSANKKQHDLKVVLRQLADQYQAQQQQEQAQETQTDADTTMQNAANDSDSETLFDPSGLDESTSTEDDQPTDPEIEALFADDGSSEATINENDNNNSQPTSSSVLTPPVTIIGKRRQSTYSIDEEKQPKRPRLNPESTASSLNTARASILDKDSGSIRLPELNTDNHKNYRPTASSAVNESSAKALKRCALSNDEDRKQKRQRLDSQPTTLSPVNGHSEKALGKRPAHSSIDEDRDTKKRRIDSQPRAQYQVYTAEQYQHSVNLIAARMYKNKIEDQAFRRQYESGIIPGLVKEIIQGQAQQAAVERVKVGFGEEKLEMIQRNIPRIFSHHGPYGPRIMLSPGPEESYDPGEWRDPCSWARFEEGGKVIWRKKVYAC